jgi:1-phosphofructokinase family hexose kinase
VIVVLSMNTAVDRLMLVPDFTPGEVYRAQRAEYFAGGKALNVARVLRQLGEPVRVIGTLGGMPEGFIRAWCDRAGVDGRWVRVVAESRTCVTVIDPGSERQTVLNEPGPTLTSEEIEGIDAEIDTATREGDTLCISGSAPPGVPDNFYAGLVRRMRTRGVKVLVDASGEPLRLALEARPWAAAPNAQECAAALGSDENPGSLVVALAEHVDHAMVTLGRKGLLYAHGRSAWRVSPPKIHAVNAVGSGDAFVAGFLAGMTRGLPDHEAVRLGVACGASNAARFEPGIGSPAELECLSALVRVDPLQWRSNP